jgi:hypothetical protein
MELSDATKKIPSDTTGDRSRDLSTSSAVPMYIQLLREMVPSPSQNTVAVCNQITLLIPYYISSRLVTLIKVNDAPLHV